MYHYFLAFALSLSFLCVFVQTSVCLLSKLYTHKRASAGDSYANLTYLAATEKGNAAAEVI